MSSTLRAAMLAAGWLIVGSSAWAGEVLDRVQRNGFLQCAAVERPGFADVEDGKPSGLAANLCRDMAAQLLGPGGRYGLRLLDVDSDYDRVRRGEVDVVFLEPRIASAEQIGGVLSRVGEAYREPFAIMLPQGGFQRTLGDLDHATVCFMIGDPVWPILDRAMRARGIAFRPYGFSEDVEMKDAYNVGRCDAVAGVSSALVAMSEDGGVRLLKSRLLAEDLGADPVDVMVPASDAAWAAWVTSRLHQDAR